VCFVVLKFSLLLGMLTGIGEGNTEFSKGERRVACQHTGGEPNASIVEKRSGELLFGFVTC